MKSSQSVLFIVFHTKRIVAYDGMRVNENIAFIVFFMFSDCKLLVKSGGCVSSLRCRSEGYVSRGWVRLPTDFHWAENSDEPQSSQFSQQRLRELT